MVLEIPFSQQQRPLSELMGIKWEMGVLCFELPSERIPIHSTIFEKK